ncbi:unnamed protein product [Clavelina lepadiformis]|uniref:Uncharacterized protein n=1 Tax=Clavelina lepadiformis TaxID=159417 RepID=A0ABP0FJB5_CLALP
MDYSANSRGYVKNEIREIASDPDSDYAFGLSQFDQLVTILKERVSVQAYKIPAVVPDDIEVPISIQSGDTHYFEVQMPTNGSIELNYTVTTFGASAIVTTSAALKLAKNTFSESLSSIGRKKRAVGGSTETYSVYVAVVVTRDEPVDATVKVTGSNTRPVKCDAKTLTIMASHTNEVFSALRNIVTIRRTTTYGFISSIEKRLLIDVVPS